jgi:TonB family protein
MLIMKWTTSLLLTMVFHASVSLPVTVVLAQNLPSPSEDLLDGKHALQPPLLQARSVQDPSSRSRDVNAGISEEYGPGFTKISFKDIVGEKGYRYFLLSNPPRLVLDVPKPPRKPSLRKRTLKGEAFRRLRVGQYPDKVRFVLDFRQDEGKEPAVSAEGRDLTVLVVSPIPEPDAGVPSEVLFGGTLAEHSEGNEGRSATTIRETVALYIGGLQYLYNQELRKDPTLHGKVTVTFEIDPSGRVTETILVSSSIRSKSLVEAILGSIRKWKFPGVSEEYGNVRITYPFAFVIRSL